ncbi:hypothetical protein LTR17_017851 [Elasticomyces elasticus]|nr:hypothetical protein LTR17_017851 [Elasticomyces elasticus]
MPTGPPTLWSQSHEVDLENDHTRGSQQQLSVESPSSTDLSSSSELIVRVCGNYFSIYKTQDGQRIWSLGALNIFTSDVLATVQVDRGFVEFMNRTEPAEDTWEQGGPSRLCINRSTLIRSMLRELLAGNPQLRLNFANVKFGEGLREPSEAEISDALQNFKHLWNGIELTPRSFRKAKKKSKSKMDVDDDAEDAEQREYPSSTTQVALSTRKLRKSTRQASGKNSGQQVEDFEETPPAVKAEASTSTASRVAAHPLQHSTAAALRDHIGQHAIVELDSDNDVVVVSPIGKSNGGGNAVLAGAEAQSARRTIKVQADEGGSVSGSSGVAGALSGERISMQKARKRARLELDEQEAEAEEAQAAARQRKIRARRQMLEDDVE